MAADIDEAVRKSNEFKAQKKFDDALRLLDEAIVKVK